MAKEAIFRVESKEPLLKGYSHLWIKSVKDFIDTKHCARCFVGKYIDMKPSHYTIPFETNKEYRFELDNNPTLQSVLINGELLHYFCIVSAPYNWNLNIHAGFIYEKGSEIVRMFKGQKIIISNVREIYFDDSVVKKKYNHLSKSFTTCRNFWFGAYYYEGN